MESSIRTVQLEQFFEPYRMIFKELKKRKKQFTSQCLQRQHNTKKKYWNFVYFRKGTFNHPQIFAFRRQSRNLTPREERNECNFPSISFIHTKNNTDLYGVSTSRFNQQQNKRLLPSGRNPDSWDLPSLLPIAYFGAGKRDKSGQIVELKTHLHLCRVELHLEHNTFNHGVVLNLTQE